MPLAFTGTFDSPTIGATLNTAPHWPSAKHDAGLYESFFLRAVSPDEPVGVWIRHTVHKRPEHPPRASVWFTFFEQDSRPIAHKETVEEAALVVPADGWIKVLDSSFGPEGAEGECGPARWSLRISEPAAPLRHLAAPLYGSPIPRTKVESPIPHAILSGELEVAGRGFDLAGWRAMAGHNWGAGHAERWVWLNGTCFEGAEDDWIDVAIGRIRVAGILLPPVVNGAASIGGNLHRIGGAARIGSSVEAEVGRLELVLKGQGARFTARLTAPPTDTVGWTYAGPWGDPHEVLNCSVAPLHLQVERRGSPILSLHAPHGGAYELGRLGHGLQDLVPIEPFEDG